MTTEVVVPWRGGCAHRERALEWLLERLPYPVTVAEAPEGPWSKGATVWPAVARSEADIVVTHDADVWCDGLADAVAAVEDGEPWAMPHERVHRLTAQATDALINGTQPPRRSRLEHYRGLWGGGVVVVARETYLSVPIDPRFLGWGGEDISWSRALWHLYAKGWRGTSDLTHLYHPSQPRLTRDLGSVENRALEGRYRAARFKPDEMRALVNEGREVLHELGDTSQQAVSAGAPLR